MKTLINITFEDIKQAILYVYTGHGADGFMRTGCTLTLERDGEPVKYITGLKWKNNSLLEPEKNQINNIVLGYINNIEDITSGRLYVDLLSNDKIYLNTP